MTRAGKFAVFLLIIACIYPRAYCQPASDDFSQHVGYTWDAVIDTNALLTVNGTIRYTNHSPVALDTLYLHLWMNALRTNTSPYAKQLQQSGDRSHYFMPENERGGYRALTILCMKKMLDLHFLDEGEETAYILLPQSLRPGEELLLDVAYELSIPKRLDRFGRTEEMIHMTHWYPRLAVFDQAGWHVMPYLRYGEFYGEFSDFNTSLQAPKEWTIVQPLETESILDFPIFIYKHKDVAANEWTVHDVRIQSYAGKQSETWQQLTILTHEALDFFESALGPFPFPTLVIVQSDETGSGGMEYPGLIVLNKTDDARQLEYYLVHEMAHQYFYASLASNERDEPFLDEGMATYLEGRYALQKYGEHYFNGRLPDWLLNGHTDFVLHKVWQQLRRNDQSLADLAHGPDAHPIAYGLVNYPNAAVAIGAMAQEMGEARFHEAIKAYYNRSKFTHVDWTSFIRFLEAEYNHRSSYTRAYFLKGQFDESGSERDRKIAIKFLPALDHEDKQECYVLPLPLYNTSDGISPGLAITNSSLPSKAIKYLASPAFSLSKKQFAGQFILRGDFRPGPNNSIWQPFLRFKTYAFERNERHDYHLNYYKYSAGINRIDGKGMVPNNRSSALGIVYDYIVEERALFSGPEDFEFKDFHFSRIKAFYDLDRADVFQPYAFNVTAEVVPEYNDDAGFGRVTMSYKQSYFFAAEKSFDLRLWGGFHWWNAKRRSLSFNNLLVKGSLGLSHQSPNDYAYDRYFFDRNTNRLNQSTDAGGGFRTVFNGNRSLGQSNDAAAAINLTTDLPFLPLKKNYFKLFFDLGTYSRFEGGDERTFSTLYSGGILLQLFKGKLEVALPLVNSSEINAAFRDEGSSFFNRISFRTDVLNWNIWDKIEGI